MQRASKQFPGVIPDQLACSGINNGRDALAMCCALKHPIKVNAHLLGIRQGRRLDEAGMVAHQGGLASDSVAEIQCARG